jgi:hypothetical protein
MMSTAVTVVVVCEFDQRTLVSLVGCRGVPVQEGCLDPHYVLVVETAGVDVVVSAAAAI